MATKEISSSEVAIESSTSALLGDSDGVDQNVIELERRSYCDSDAWTPPLIVRKNAPPVQPLPGELMRLY